MQDSPERSRRRIDSNALGRLNPWLEALEPASAEAFAAALESLSLAPGEVLFRKGDPVDAIFVVIAGRLEVRGTRRGGETVVLGKIATGEPVGEVQILVGGERGSDVYADGSAIVGRCSRADFQALSERFADLASFARDYSVHRLRANKLREVLPRLLGSIDRRLLAEIEIHGRWRRLTYGEILFRQGDPVDSMSILVSGRLRVGAPPRFVAEVAPGEAIGEMGLFLADEPRSETVLAIRASEVVSLSREAFEQIGQRHPRLLGALASLLARRLKDVTTSGGRASAKVKNVALVPLGNGVPIAAVAERLIRGLSSLGTVLLIDRVRMNRLLGVDDAAEVTAADPLKLKMARIAEREEAKHDLIVYLAESEATPWTRHCLDQADRVLLVADTTDDPEPDASEMTLMTQRHAELLTHTSLVLLHPNRDRLPTGTRVWLTFRKVDSHYHVCMDRDEDFERLARFVAGRAIGLVLSGGGVRTIAHLGVIRALGEFGIPIDMIGGTSGGASVAVEYAVGTDGAATLAHTRHTMQKVKPFSKFTFPYTSVLSNREVQRVHEEMYGDLHLEDLWLPTYCVSCNLSTGEAVVHSAGPVGQACIASTAIPVILPPVVYREHLLVDGGVVANLPVSTMQDLGANVIIGSDVSPQEYLSADYPGGELPSGWRILRHRLLPFLRPLTAPSIAEIMMRLVTLNDTKMRDDAWRRCDLLIKPRVESFGMMDFAALDEIHAQGYEDARRAIEALAADSPLRTWSAS